MMFGLRPHYERMLMGNPEEVRSGGGGSGGGSVYQPPVDTYEAWREWNRLGRPGGDFWAWFNSRQQGAANQAAMRQIADLLKQYPGAVQIDDTLWKTPSGIVIELTYDDSGTAFFKENGAEQSRAILKNLATSTSGTGTGTRLASDDPRYWEMQQKQLEAQLMNMGLDAESARRQALTTLITNRNNTAVDTASLAAQIAKQKADYMANPRDSFAELYYANQVGGSTPFGDITNPEFQKYSGALREKGDRMFTDVNSDLQQLRTYRDSIAPLEFLGPETRQQLGLPPTAAQGLTGGGGAPAVATGSAAPAPNLLQQLAQRLEAMNPQEAWDFRNYTTGGEYGKTTPRPMAKGGKINFDGLFESRDKPGYSPASSEGGTNLNLHERAVVVGESGHVYATLGEKRPDGTMRAEQLIVKPLKSEVEKDKKLEEGKKAVVETQRKTLASFAEGGAINASPTPEDLMEQLSIYLNRLGGQGGGTGFGGEGLADPRLLAGAPWEALQKDRRRLLQTYGGYSSMPYGIDPLELEDTIKKFTPPSPINNIPRVSF